MEVTSSDKLTSLISLAINYSRKKVLQYEPLTNKILLHWERNAAACTINFLQWYNKFTDRLE